MILGPDEVDAARRRIEKYFGLGEGALGLGKRLPRPIVQVSLPQDATEVIDLVQIVPEEREQVVYDIWRILQTVSALRK